MTKEIKTSKDLYTHLKTSKTNLFSKDILDEIVKKEGLSGYPVRGMLSLKLVFGQCSYSNKITICIDSPNVRVQRFIEKLRTEKNKLEEMKKRRERIKEDKKEEVKEEVKEKVKSKSKGAI